MCRVQDALSKYDDSDDASKDPSITPAASAHKSKRLSFAWLDGEAQNVSILARTPLLTFTLSHLNLFCFRNPLECLKISRLGLEICYFLPSWLPLDFSSRNTVSSMFNRKPAMTRVELGGHRLMSLGYWSFGTIEMLQKLLMQSKNQVNGPKLYGNLKLTMLILLHSLLLVMTEQLKFPRYSINTFF